MKFLGLKQKKPHLPRARGPLIVGAGFRDSAARPYCEARKRAFESLHASQRGRAKVLPPHALKRRWAALSRPERRIRCRVRRQRCRGGSTHHCRRGLAPALRTARFRTRSKFWTDVARARPARRHRSAPELRQRLARRRDPPHRDFWPRQDGFKPEVP